MSATTAPTAAARPTGGQGIKEKKKVKTLVGMKDVDLWGLRFTKLHSRL